MRFLTMKLFLRLTLLVINAETSSIKPRSVNLTLETVLKFKNQDNSADLQFIDNVQRIFSKVRNAIGGRKIDRRNFSDSDTKIKFSEFIENLIITLENYNDKDLEDVSAVLSDELRKHHYENCKFYELLGNEDMRRFVGRRLDQMKYVSAAAMRKKLNNFLTLLQGSELDDNVQELIDYVDSLYTTSSASKLNKFIGNIKLYSKKSKRANLDLVKVVREGIRNIIFDHYTNLNVNARRDLKSRLETFWKSYMQSNTIKHNGSINVKSTKFYKSHHVSSSKGYSTRDLYSNNTVIFTNKFNQTQYPHKRNIGIHVKDAASSKVYKSYEVAKKVPLEDDGSPFQNFDDTFKLSTENNKKYTILPIVHDNDVLDDTDKGVVQTRKPDDGRTDNQFIHDIDNETFLNKSIKSSKFVKVHNLKRLKPLEMIKRKRTKSKYNKKGITVRNRHNKSRFKQNKTKHTKYLKHGKGEGYEDDNSKNAPAFMKAIVTEAQVPKPVKKYDESDITRKAIFLTLYPEDFTVKFTRKRLSNKVTRKKHKRNTIWEGKVSDIKMTPKSFDSELNKMDVEDNSHGHRDYVNTTDTPESIENFHDKTEITKPKQYHKLQQKRSTKYFKNYKKFRKSRANSDEGISIESFENDYKYITYRKMNDNQPNASSLNINRKFDIIKQFGFNNVTEITTQSNQKLNEIDYGALDFWEGTTTKTSMNYTSVVKTVTSDLQPTTTPKTHTKITNFVSNSTHNDNTTTLISDANKATKTIEIILRANDINQSNGAGNIIEASASLPLASVKNILTNATTLNSPKTTAKNNLKIVKHIPSNPKYDTESMIRSPITNTTNIQTTVSTSISKGIKTSPKFNLGNFLNNSKIEADGDRKKLMHEKIMKDMQVVFAPRTRPTVNLPRDATDPFKDIEEAFDFM